MSQVDLRRPRGREVVGVEDRVAADLSRWGMGRHFGAMGSAWRSRWAATCYEFQGAHQSMNVQTVASASLALSLLACSGSGGSGGKPDLPAGWEGAQSVKSFTQAACSGSPGLPGGPSESIDVDAGQGAVNVAYHNANFRCAQTVEGFMRTGSKSVDFLVQPTNMKPSSVARCDCLYEIALAAGVPAGPTTVTLYRRWDEQSGNTNPVEIGTEAVDVP